MAQVTAKIVVAQAGNAAPGGYVDGGRDDLVTGSLITLTNADNAGALGHKWVITPCAALDLSVYGVSGTESSSCTLTPPSPDGYGDAFVELTVFGAPINGAPNIAIDRVPLGIRASVSGYAAGVPIPSWRETSAGGRGTLSAFGGREFRLQEAVYAVVKQLLSSGVGDVTFLRSKNGSAPASAEVGGLVTLKSNSDKLGLSMDVGTKTISISLADFVDSIENEAGDTVVGAVVLKNTDKIEWIVDPMTGEITPDILIDGGGGGGITGVSVEGGAPMTGPTIDFVADTGIEVTEGSDTVQIGLSSFALVRLAPSTTSWATNSAYERLRFDANSATPKTLDLFGQDGTGGTGGDLRFAGGDGSLKGEILFGYVSAGNFNETWRVTQSGLTHSNAASTRYGQKEILTDAGWRFFHNYGGVSRATAIGAGVGTWKIDYVFSDQTVTPLAVDHDKVTAAGILDLANGSSDTVPLLRTSVTISGTRTKRKELYQIEGAPSGTTPVTFFTFTIPQYSLVTITIRSHAMLAGGGAGGFLAKQGTFLRGAGDAVAKASGGLIDMSDPELADGLDLAGADLTSSVFTIQHAGDTGPTTIHWSHEVEVWIKTVAPLCSAFSPASRASAGRAASRPPTSAQRFSAPGTPRRDRSGRRARAVRLRLGPSWSARGMTRAGPVGISCRQHPGFGHRARPPEP